eukprot:2897014-Rhodomonas_salina.1
MRPTGRGGDKGSPRIMILVHLLFSSESNRDRGRGVRRAVTRAPRLALPSGSRSPSPSTAPSPECS